MRAFVTGATGFIGGRVATKLRRRGDEVVALVRSPDKAGGLAAMGCESVAGDLGEEEGIRRAVEGCDRELGYSPRDMETGLRQTFASAD
jgi:UDP-glucose 4-epimerase